MGGGRRRWTVNVVPSRYWHANEPRAEYINSQHDTQCTSSLLVSQTGLQVRRHPLLRRRGRAADVREGEGRLTNRPSGARPNLDKGQGRSGENTSGVWSLSREPSQFHTLISLLGLQPASLDNLTSCFHTTVELKIMHQVEVLHLSVSSRNSPSTIAERCKYICKIEQTPQRLHRFAV